MTQDTFEQRVLEVWVTTRVPLTRANVQFYTGAKRAQVDRWLDKLVGSGVLEVDADVDTLRAALHWGDADFAPSATGGCRVRIEGSSDDALLRVVTWLAGRHPVTVVEPPSVATLVTDLVARLSPPFGAAMP